MLNSLKVVEYITSFHLWHMLLLSLILSVWVILTTWVVLQIELACLRMALCLWGETVLFYVDLLWFVLQVLRFIIVLLYLNRLMKIRVVRPRYLMKIVSEAALINISNLSIVGNITIINGIFKQTNCIMGFVLLLSLPLGLLGFSIWLSNSSLVYHFQIWIISYWRCILPLLWWSSTRHHGFLKQ